MGKDRPLGYDPCTLGWFSKGEYIVVGGSNKQCCLHTRDGHYSVFLIGKNPQH
jgi:intraflagellar transport protein 122